MSAKRGDSPRVQVKQLPEIWSRPPPSITGEWFSYDAANRVLVRLDALYGSFGLDKIYRQLPLSGLSADVVRSFPARALAPLPIKPKPPGAEAMALKLTRGALLPMAAFGQTGCGAFPGLGPHASAHFDATEVAELAQAACDGDAVEVAERIAAGVPVSATGKSDITPLGFAVTCGSVEGVRALLKGGADPNYRH